MIRALRSDVTASRNLKAASLRTTLPSHSTTASSPISQREGPASLPSSLSRSREHDSCHHSPACVLWRVRRLRRRASGTLGRSPRKSALQQLLYLGRERDGTSSKRGTALPTIVFTAMRQDGLTMARALFGNSMTGLGHVVRTKSHAA